MIFIMGDRSKGLMSRKITMLKLWIYTILGKNHKKAEIVRKSNLFKKFGGGGIGIPHGFLPILI